MASIYYVYQKSSYKQERSGGYLWSPQKARNGAKKLGFANMTLIKSGDYILHHVNKRILSISKVVKDCYECDKPSEYATGEWEKNGYRIDVEYYDLDVPLNVLEYSRYLIPSSKAQKGNAFSKDGKPVQSYVCTLEDLKAEFLLKKMLATETRNEVIEVIVSALESIGGYVTVDDQSDYATDDFWVKQLWGSVSGQWKNESKPRHIVERGGNVKRAIPVRNPKISINALKHADNKCENDSRHVTFKRKSMQIYYMESHHLIPISRYNDFDYSLDIEENIICLCPTCHRLLHHGSMSEKETLLKKLYNARKQALMQCGLEVTFDKLKSYYK